MPKASRFVASSRTAYDGNDGMDDRAFRHVDDDVVWRLHVLGRLVFHALVVDAFRY
jgi:hypothetical protein